MSKSITQRHSMLKLRHLTQIPKLNLPQQQHDPSDFIIQLPKDIYESFLNMLTINSIKDFSLKCKEHFLKQNAAGRKGSSIKKNVFISLLKSTFSYDEKYTLLYEQLLRRFNTLTCEIKCQSKKLSNYFISNISSSDEVNVYEFTCALVCYLKCDFENKLKLIFELTDKDDDGYINEIELKQMIFTINSLFSEEEKPININSTIMHQSLASIKSHQSYLLLMKRPGNLSKLFSKYKYIDFPQFHEAVLKIPQYRFNLFPFYINLKKSLLTDKNEENFSIRENIYNEFAVISKDIISEVKHANDIGKTYTDFKKSLEPIMTERSPQYTHLDNSSNNNTTTCTTLPTKKMNSFYGTVVRGFSTLINSSINKTKTKFLKRSKHPCTISPIKGRGSDRGGNDMSNEETFIVNYNKINGMETFPKKITIEDDSMLNSNMHSTAREYSNNYIKRRMLQHAQNKIRSVTSRRNGNSMLNTYMNFSEVISEIDIQIDKHKTQFPIHEELNRLNKKIEKRTFKYRLKLRDKNPYEKKTFGKFTIIPKPNNLN